MTREEYIAYIISDVNPIIDDNLISILEILTDGLMHGLNQEQIKLCSRAIRISVQLSCLILLDELCERGILEPALLSLHQGRP